MMPGSPFQPDAASDWWNFAATMAAAMAGGAAVWVSVFTARAARADAKAARAETAAVIAESIVTARRADAARKAERQATAIHVEASWPAPGAADMMWPTLTVNLHNRSDRTVTSVDIQWDVRHNLPERHRGEAISADSPADFGSMTSLAAGGSQLFTGMRYQLGEYGSELGFRVSFTDAYHDRWRAEPDGSILLVSPPLVDVAQ